MIPAPMQTSLAQRAAAPTSAHRVAEIVFRLPVRVYWEDTDAGGIVFYANYLKFFERARTDAIFVVTHTSMQYRVPARLDDALEITVAVMHTGRASLQVAQQAWRIGTAPSAWPPAPAGESHGKAGSARETLLADGEVRIGCVDAATMRPCRIPPELQRALA